MVLSRVLDRIRTVLGSLPPVTGRDLLVVACWSGIVFGLAEGVIAIIRRRINHLPIGEYSWTELLWMPPLAAVSVLTLVASIVIVLDRHVRERGLLLQLALPGMICVVTYGVLSSARLGMWSFAAWVLALGVAAQSTRIPARWLSSVRHAARWQLPLAMAALAFWPIGLPLVLQLREQHARQALPPPAVGAPNVLLIIWDTARALSLSLYGHTRKTTPELEAFAANGVVFEHAFAPSAWSLPSHAALYTGRYPHETNVGRTGPLDDTYPTLGEVLERHGYVTAGFTGNLFYGSRDFGIARGFGWYDDEAHITPQKVASAWSLTRRSLVRWRDFVGDHQDLVRRPAEDVTGELLHWIDRRGSRPFFASVNYFDAHYPYLAPAPFNLAFTTYQPRYWLGEPRPTDPNVWRDLQAAYESCILYLDSELGRLLAALRQRGVLDNTLVIITSDHGEQFGDHDVRFVGHERSLYASVLRVPLVMVFPPRVPAGARHHDVVSLRDIPATVTDILGLPARDRFPGISLLRYATGTATEADIGEPRMAHLRPNKVWPPSLLDWAKRKSHIFSLASGSLHYLVNASGEEELYDFVRDPWETDDLTGDSAATPALERFRAALDSMVPSWQSLSPDTIAH